VWKRFAWIGAASLAAVGFAALVLAVWFASGGIGAKRAPGRFEAAVARRARSLAIPRTARSLRNPVAWTPEAAHDGMAHFADHCAVCHANDGSGDTEMGRGLYPRAPDMRRAATQSLSDGELFYIIENGVRLTGMPAWGARTEESEAASWRLVHFIRHLPKLTDTELEEMKELNPKSPDEWREEEETRKFLAGDTEPPRPAAGHDHGAHTHK
jgi:mono/diheme cytochrome c family protein